MVPADDGLSVEPEDRLTRFDRWFFPFVVTLSLYFGYRSGSSDSACCPLCGAEAASPADQNRHSADAEELERTDGIPPDKRRVERIRPPRRPHAASPDERQNEAGIHEEIRTDII